MRILVEPSQTTYRNVGDTAMLQIGVDRIKAAIPGAEIGVYTHDPEGLARLVPSAMPVNATDSELWAYSRLIPPKLDGIFGIDDLSRMERLLRDRAPGTYRRLLKLRLQIKDRKVASEHVDRFIATIRESDAFVFTGMGAITDAFAHGAVARFAKIALAHHFGVPVLMFGQGIGPLHSRDLRDRACAVLPRVRLIALREKIAGPALLSELGVEPERVTVTGDDAIEVAYRERPAVLGNRIGVNLRLTSYSKVAGPQVETIGRAIRSASTSLAAMMVSTPINFQNEGHDITAFRTLVGGHPNCDDVTHPDAVPEQVATQIGKCRIVVAGSYHAGVFALAQGIPVVAIVGSDYYHDKFAGLRDMFGVGCLVVRVEDAEEELESSIIRLWRSAEDHRPAMLSAAERQISAQNDTYRQAFIRCQETVG